MSWTKTNKSTRSLLFVFAILGLATTGLWFGAQFNSAEANTAGAVSAPAATFPANPGTTGAIPDAAAAGCAPNNDGAARNVTFNVTGISGSPTNVEISTTFGGPNHSWMGDVTAVLIAPNGASHTLFGKTGTTTTSSFCGDSSDLAGPYNFKDTAAGTNWWQAAATAGSTTALPSGDYRTTARGPQASTTNPTITSLNTAFAGVPNVAGTWTLRLTDGGGGDTGAISAATLTIEAGPSGPVSDANVDMDGDGKTDWVVTRETDVPLAETETRSASPSLKGIYTVRERKAAERAAKAKGETENLGGSQRITWYTSINGTGATSVTQLGDSAEDILVPNDYDGDGKTDHAVWRPGAPFSAAFYILQSSNLTVRTDVFGQTGDDPAITGDYDGDGKADTATYRCPAFGAGDGQCYFFYRPSSQNNNTPQGIYVVPWGFGEDGDFFVNPGDFDGDGKNDFCIQRTRPGTADGGQFVLLRSSDFGVEFIDWGRNDDFILPGDYDGDGKDDFCVRRTSGTARHHYILERDGGGTGANPIVWGITGDQSAPGDYDGDGKQDVAVFRPNADDTQNFFYVRRSSDGAVQAFEWGKQGDAAAAGWAVH